MERKIEKVVIANPDYELGPETAYGRQVHHKGKQIGSVFYITAAETGEPVRYLALVQIYRTSYQFITRCLGEFFTLDEAFVNISGTHMKESK